MKNKRVILLIILSVFSILLASNVLAGKATATLSATKNFETNTPYSDQILIGVINANSNGQVISFKKTLVTDGTQGHQVKVGNTLAETLQNLEKLIMNTGTQGVEYWNSITALNIPNNNGNFQLNGDITIKARDSTSITFEALTDGNPGYNYHAKEVIDQGNAFTFGVNNKFSNASIVTSCQNPDDIILRLSGTGNAHAAIYSDTAYSTDICYSDFFGNYTGNLSTVHECSGKDAVAWLSGATNAHGNDYEGAFDIPLGTQIVCYGNLDCTIEGSSGSTCADSSRTAIAFMSGSSNAHFATTYSSDYPEKICCKLNVTGSYKWTNALGTEITSARVGDKVKAVAKSYSGTPDSTFDILEDDPFFDDSVKSSVAGTSSGGDWIYEWNITSSDVTKSESNDYDKFFFEINNVKSPYLSISYCGDGIVQSAHETCDIPGDSCSSGYNSSCEFCNNECQWEFVASGYCGDGVIQSSQEECDDGALNADTCTPSSGSTCSFCKKNTCDLILLDNNQVYWTDLSGDIITKASVGDIVKMFYPNGAGKTTEKFEVYEDDGLLGKDDMGFFDGKTSGSDYYSTWKITSNDVDKANDLGDPAYEFRFKINGKESGDLDIIESTIDSDEKIRINVSNPVCGSEFYLGDEIEIKFEVTDPDDLVDVKLSIDGNEVLVDTQTAGKEFRYNNTFTTSGTKEIKVYATNEENDEASFISNVIVIDKTKSGQDYLAACITKPANFEYISDSKVQFDASSSKALRYTGSSDYYTLQELKFKWTFSDGTTNPYVLGTNKLSYEFYKQFDNFGKNWAELEIELI